MAAFADGVVIGTRLIEVLEEGDPQDAAARAGNLVRALRDAMDAQAQAQAQAPAAGAGKRPPR